MTRKYPQLNPVAVADEGVTQHHASSQAILSACATRYYFELEEPAASVKAIVAAYRLRDTVGPSQIAQLSAAHASQVTRDTTEATPNDEGVAEVVDIPHHSKRRAPVPTAESNVQLSAAHATQLARATIRTTPNDEGVAVARVTIHATPNDEGVADMVSSSHHSTRRALAPIAEADEQELTLEPQLPGSPNTPGADPGTTSPDDGPGPPREKIPFSPVHSIIQQSNAQLRDHSCASDELTNEKNGKLGRRRLTEDK